MVDQKRTAAAEASTIIRPVILAGGSGTRLWPFSRVQRPKQFLNLVEEQSLFQATLSRLNRIPGISTPIIVCAAQHQLLVTEQLHEANIADYQIVLEPTRRDTAAAITLAVLLAAYADENTVLFVLASDHDIRCDVALANAVKNAVDVAATGKLVTFGVRPTSAHTGYGYIKVKTPPSRLDKNQQGYVVQSFVEKPNQSLAQTYFLDDSYFWNSGMFVFGVKTMLSELAQHATGVLAGCEKTLANSVWCEGRVLKVHAASFAACPSVSIDYAVMEKSQQIAMVPLETEWNDVGDWSALWQIAEKDVRGNVQIGDVQTTETQNCYVRSSEKLVATVGVENLVIVESDDAILIANKDSTQKIKDVVKGLESQARREVTCHKQVYRHWGHYRSVADGHRFQVNRIVVKPGEKLPMHKHFHRAEHWVVVHGTAKVARNDETFLLSENESVYIPVGAMHGLENPGQINLEMMEIQTGSYLGEDDIVLFTDSDADVVQPLMVAAKSGCEFVADAGNLPNKVVEARNLSKELASV